MTVRLIQGVVFPSEEALELMKAAGYSALLAAAMKSSPGGATYSMFSGILFPDPTKHDGGIVGRMNDRGGESFLHDVVLSRGELAFTRRYQEGEKYDSTGFHFRRTGSLWVGEYRGESGRGAAKCIITMAPKSFFNLDKPPKKEGRRRS